MIVVYTLDSSLATRKNCEVLSLKALVGSVRCFDLPLYSRVQPRVPEYSPEYSPELPRAGEQEDRNT